MKQEDLDFFVENNLNVLFEGRHGVGKTAIVKETFERHNLKWKYFSAATMDPWVDFVGAPKDMVDENGEKFLDLIRPKDFHNKSVEAIFMDELNRAPKKVRNAVMELIQFKSINGTPFPNLRFVWAAINPEEDEDEDLNYDVEMLDPAQKDRFHVIINVPYKPDKSYFKKMYGDSGEGAVEWWHTLKNEQKDNISPRRLEYAVKIHQMMGNVKHILTDNKLNITKLLQLLDHGSLDKKLKQLYTASEPEKVKAFSNINFTTNIIDSVVNNPDYIRAFIEYMPKDMVSGYLFKADKKAEKILKNVSQDSEYVNDVLESLSKTIPKKKKEKLYKMSNKNPLLHPDPQMRDANELEKLLIDAYFSILHKNSNTNRRNDWVYGLNNFYVLDMTQQDKENITFEELVKWFLVIAAAISRTNMNKPSVMRNEIDKAHDNLTELIQISTFNFIDVFDEGIKELGRNKKNYIKYDKKKLITKKEFTNSDLAKISNYFYP